MEIEVDITKKFKDFNFHIDFKAKSSRIGILGASGSGKSLALKSIAGIAKPDFGKISINGNLIFDSEKKIDIKPQKRKVGYLFQNYALFPNMNVAQNILCGAKIPRSEKNKFLEKLIKQFRLEGYENHFPHELSGGQQQRVALARIFACSPDVILLDEPFSALDAFLKEQVQLELFDYLKNFSGSVILVSHDRDEIYRFSDELLVIENGASICFGKTKMIFENPVYKSAAVLTGCKNYSKLKRIDDFTFYLEDWKCTVKTSEKIPPDINFAGYRAHDFIPVWENSDENSCRDDILIQIQLRQISFLQFERNYYFTNGIVWKVQKDLWEKLDKKGPPKFLKLDISKLMFLK